MKHNLQDILLTHYLFIVIWEQKTANKQTIGQILRWWKVSLLSSELAVRWKKELKQHILGGTTRNPPRTPSVNKCNYFSAPEKEIHISTGFWHLNVTWLLHRTAVHAFFAEHDAISVSLLDKILHNLPQTHGAPVVRYFFCKQCY